MPIASGGVEFRGRVYHSIVDTIGATPLVRLGKIAADAGVTTEILGKCEFFNPLDSVKDRIAVSMVEAAERDGRLKPTTVLVEPTSANDVAFDMARRLARIEGVPVAISAVVPALEVGKRPTMKGRVIVAVLPDFAERYMSTALFDGV